MRSGGAECAIGSCTSFGDDPAEAIGIRLYWNGERANGAQGLQPLSPLESASRIGVIISGPRAIAPIRQDWTLR